MTDFWYPPLAFLLNLCTIFVASYPLGPASLQHLPGALYGAAQTPHRPRPPLGRSLLCLVLVVLLLCISKCLMTPLPPTSFTLLFFMLVVAV